MSGPGNEIEWLTVQGALKTRRGRLGGLQASGCKPRLFLPLSRWQMREDQKGCAKHADVVKAVQAPPWPPKACLTSYALLEAAYKVCAVTPTL